MSTERRALIGLAAVTVTQAVWDKYGPDAPIWGYLGWLVVAALWIWWFVTAPSIKARLDPWRRDRAVLSTILVFVFCGTLGSVLWLMRPKVLVPASSTIAATAPTTQAVELPVSVRLNGMTGSTLQSQKNQLFFWIPLDLTNTEVDGVSVEAWLKVVPFAKTSVFVRADAVRSPLMPPSPFAVPGDFLGFVTNIPGHSTVSGIIAFMLFETELQTSFGVQNMRDFGMDVPKYLELRDRVSGRTRVYDVLGGNATEQMNKNRNVAPPTP